MTSNPALNTGRPSNFSPASPGFFVLAAKPLPIPFQAGTPAFPSDLRPRGGDRLKGVAFYAPLAMLPVAPCVRG
jgi:hypothetical protein